MMTTMADAYSEPLRRYPSGRICPGVRRKRYLKPKCGTILSVYDAGPLCDACALAQIDIGRACPRPPSPDVERWLKAQRHRHDPAPTPPELLALRPTEARALERCECVEVAELGDLPPEPVRRLSRSGLIMRWGARKGAWQITEKGRRALARHRKITP